jgi:hypothetical protein
LVAASITDEPQPAATELFEHRSSLEDERLLKIQELSKLEILDVEAPPQAIELLDELPVIDLEPGSVPETSLRRLFEALRLQVRYDKLDNHAQCRVTLSDDGVDAVNKSDAVARSVAFGKPTCAHVVCAPGKALPTSVQGRPAVSRRRLVIAGSFEVPRSAWARR